MLLAHTHALVHHVCCLQQGVMIAKLLREPLDLTQTGVSTDYSAPKAASIMLASASLYLMVEVSTHAVKACSSAMCCFRLASRLLCDSGSGC